MDFHVWLAFVAASTLIVFVPGPSIMLVLSYGLSQGRRVAVASAMGVALGDIIAMSASLLGLGALVLASASLFVALKWIGAAYLVFLGIKLIRSAPMDFVSETTTVLVPAKSVFFHLGLVTALNPKSIVFFIAFVPQFLNVEANLMPQFGVLIATYVSLGWLNALLYALLADKLRSKISKPSVIGWMTRLGGGALIGMGVMTAVWRRGA